MNLSIKNVPEHLVDGLRRRASKHHRSLQGELMAIVEASVAEAETLTPAALLDQLGSLGLQTPAEAVEMTRGDRDDR